MSTRTKKAVSILLVGFFVMLAALCLLPRGASAEDARNGTTGDIVLFEREGKGAEHLKELGLTPQLFTQKTIGAPFVSAQQEQSCIVKGVRRWKERKAKQPIG